MQALGAAQCGRHGLHGDPDDVVLRLLGGQGGPTGLGVETEEGGLRVLGPEPFGHQLGPHPPGGPILGDLLEQVVVGVPEEAEPGGEGVDVETGGQGGLHVGDAVGDGEGDLLHRRRSGLSDVVAGDGDGVPRGQVLGTVGEGVGDESHRRAGGIDVGTPGHVLLQDVVLDRAAQSFGSTPVSSATSW